MPIGVYPRTPLLDRLLNHSDPLESGCWQWTGYISIYGYGLAHVGGRKGGRAARVSYETFIGPIPPNLTIDHLCRNRACVNPTHLEPVTWRENVLRGDTVTARNHAKVVCLRGHPLSGANLYVNPSGQRQCRICVGDRQRARRAKLKAAAK